MSKVLKTAAIVIGAVALVATGVGAAIGAAAAAATTIGGVSLATIGTVASVAAGVLSLASGLTAKKPTATATGSQTSFSADPDAGIPYAFGRTGSAGNIVMRQGFDTNDAGDNDRQSFVSILSLGPVKSVGGFTSDRAPVSFGGTGAAIGALAGFMWMTTQLGAMPEPSALSFGAGAGTPPGWSSAHKLSGKAAATWTLRFDTKAKLYQNGVPAPMWIVEGGFCYDPRKDSTYPGGSGPHRLADPSNKAAYDAAVATWEYTECPYLHALKFVHGLWQRDMTNPASEWQRVMGMGAPLESLDLAAFVEGANISDANGWKVGGVIYSGDDKWESLKKILQAGMGEPLPLGAKVSCLVNAPKVSLATITIDDVVGETSVAATQPRRSRINTVTPKYRLEENNWALLPGPPISVPEHVAEDRGKRSRVIEYPFIQVTKQVATAVRYDIENAREFGPITLPLKLFWMGYKPGDCVTVELPEKGLNGQQVLLLNRQLDPSAGVVTMTARSETAAKHPFALGQTTTPPSTPALTGPPLVPVPGALAWAIEATELAAGPDGAKLPALLIAGAADAFTAEAVVFEYRPFVSGQAPDAGWIAAGIDLPNVTQREIVSLIPGTAYEAAVSYRVRGVTGARRILGPVTVGTLVAGGYTGEGALLDLIAAAADIATGKSTIFYQPTPPIAAESGENDRWIDTANGNFEYRRLAGNGQLAFGGSRLTFGGSGLIVPPWTPAPDQRIGQALINAAGAQATADRKVITFSQEATPTAEGIGDLWYQPSAKSLKRWSGSIWLEVSTVGATPDQIAQIGAALSAAENAQATADGKIDTFYGPTAPIGADEGDLWFDTANGNKLYRNSGVSWVLARDVGIATAITAAAGAQATADGRVSTFVGTSAPTANALGDLWYHSTSGVLSRWNGSAWISTADNTVLNQHSIPQINDLRIQANHLGVPAAGQLPASRFVQHLVGTTDQSANSAITATASGGVTITVNNTPGDAQRGLITIASQALPLSCTVKGNSTYGGVSLPFSFKIDRDDAPPPNTGSGAGGSNPPGPPASDSSLTPPGTSTGHVVASDVLTVKVGDNGTVNLDAALSFTAASQGNLFDPEGALNRTMAAKWIYSANGSSGWGDVGSEAASNVSAQHYYQTSTPKGEINNQGSCSISRSKTGLTPGAYAYFQLLGRSTGGDINSLTGNAVATPQ